MLFILRGTSCYCSQTNYLRVVRKQLQSIVNLKLAEVSTLQLDIRIVFQSQSEPLLQLIAELREVLQESVTLLPNYLTMRHDVAVGKYLKAPGELYYPETVTIDSNNRISVFSDKEEFLTSFILQDM